MGQLLLLSDFNHGKGGINPYYYFEDVRHHWQNSQVLVIRVESSYPVTLGIPMKLIDTTPGARVAIRRWVRDNLATDVIVTLLDKSYEYISRFNHDNRERVHRSKVDHKYLVLNFEDNASSVAFALAHADLVREITDTDPDHYASLEQIKEAKDNPMLGDRYW